MKESYMDFLKSKMVIAPKSGIPINREEISDVLKPHQRDAVYWAVVGGRRALFEAFGLGKTIQQLEWCRLIHKHKGGKMLIVCPLQFDIVDRLINRYSNPGDLVFDPFGGLMTVPVRALHLGRRGIATELNNGYFRDGVGYLKEEEMKHNEPSLFDFINENAE